MLVLQWQWLGETQHNILSLAAIGLYSYIVMRWIIERVVPKEAASAAT